MINPMRDRFKIVLIIGLIILIIAMALWTYHRSSRAPGQVNDEKAIPGTDQNLPNPTLDQRTPVPMPTPDAALEEGGAIDHRFPAARPLPRTDQTTRSLIEKDLAQ